MNQSFRMAALALVVVAMLWIMLKFGIPLLANQLGGLGIELPYPAASLARRYPRLALTIIFAGTPLLLVVLGALAWRLLRQRS